MGDGRTYEHVVALRAVQTSDFMTADWAELPYALLKKVSGRIINEVRGINRVTYDVSSSRRRRSSGSERAGSWHRAHGHDLTRGRTRGRCNTPAMRLGPAVRTSTPIPWPCRPAWRARHELGATQLALLGDLVGYGPDPAAVVDRIRDAAGVRGLGAARQPTTPWRAAPPAEPRTVDEAGARWTHDQLDPSQRDYLAALPLQLESIHRVSWSTPARDAPAAWRYVNNPLVAGDSLAHAVRHEGVCCVLGGHVHLQALYYRGRGSTLDAVRARAGQERSRCRSTVAGWPPLGRWDSRVTAIEPQPSPCSTPRRHR